MRAYVSGSRDVSKGGFGGCMSRMSGSSAIDSTNAIGDVNAIGHARGTSRR